MQKPDDGRNQAQPATMKRHDHLAHGRRIPALETGAKRQNLFAKVGDEFDLGPPRSTKAIADAGNRPFDLDVVALRGQESEDPLKLWDRTIANIRLGDVLWGGWESSAQRVGEQRGIPLVEVRQAWFGDPGQGKAFSLVADDQSLAGHAVQSRPHRRGARSEASGEVADVDALTGPEIAFRQEMSFDGEVRPLACAGLFDHDPR